MLVPDVLSHPPVVSGDDRDPGLQRLVDDERGVLGPDGRHHDSVTAVEHIRNDIRVAVLVQPPDTLFGVPGQPVCQRFQALGIRTPVPSPDAEATIPGHAAESLDEVVDSLGGYVRPNIAEGEGLSVATLSVHQSFAAETVVQVRKSLRGETELVAEAPQQVLRGRDELRYGLAYLTNVKHAPFHPRAPVGNIGLKIFRSPGEVARVALPGALAVLLPVTERPYTGGIGGTHLDELAAGTHEPEVVQGEDDRYTPVARFEDERG